MKAKCIVTICIAAVFASTKAESRPTPIPTVRVQIQSCDFTFKDPFHGSIDRPKEANNFKYAGYSTTVHVGRQQRSFGFNFACHSAYAEPNQVAMQYGGRFSVTGKKWIADFQGATPDEVPLLSKATVTRQLESKNASGFYQVQEDTDGDPMLRSRHISYCLFHERDAICGFGEIRRRSGVKDDVLSYALQILQSIEFIDSDLKKSSGAAR